MSNGIEQSRRQEYLIKLVLRWGVFAFGNERDHHGRWPQKSAGICQDHRRFRRIYPLGKSLALCTRSLTRSFLVPYLCDEFPKPLLCQLCWRIRLILVSPDLSLLRQVSNYGCLQSLGYQRENRIAIHFKFISVSHAIDSPSLEGSRNRKLRQRKRLRFRRALNDLINLGDETEFDSEDFHGMESDFSFSSGASKQVRRVTLPLFCSKKIELHIFSFLTHLTWCSFSLANFTGPFPPQLRHLHLGYFPTAQSTSFSLSLLPSSLECLHFICPTSLHGPIINLIPEKEWEDFLKKCVHLRKLELFAPPQILPPGLFCHPSLRQLRCYHFSVDFVASLPKKLGHHLSSKFRRLTLLPTALDTKNHNSDTIQLSDLSTLQELSFECPLIGSPASSTVRLSELPGSAWWPAQLNTLVLHNYFSGSLAPLKDLVNLSRLRLGCSFNVPIERDHWPPNLQCLVILALRSFDQPHFPRNDLSDLSRFTQYSHYTQFFDYLPPSLSILLVGHNGLSGDRGAPQFTVTRDSRFPNCRLCSSRTLLIS